LYAPTPTPKCCCSCLFRACLPLKTLVAIGKTRVSDLPLAEYNLLYSATGIHSSLGLSTTLIRPDRCRYRRGAQGSLSDLSQQLDRLATQGQNSPKGSDYQPACLLVEDLQKQPRDMLRTGRCGKVADKEIHQLLLLQYVTTYNKVQITKFHIAALVTGGNMGAEVGPVKGLLPRHADVLPQDFKIL
jgi:hypothetical protein